MDRLERIIIFMGDTWESIFNMTDEQAIAILDKMGIGSLDKALNRFKVAGIMPKDGSDGQIRVSQNIALLRAYEALKEKVEMKKDGSD